MVNITNKINTLRTAVAVATIAVSDPATIEAVQKRKIPKGDVFEFSRAAGLLAIKQTSNVIPDCHPLPVEFAAISHAIDGLKIIITVEVHTIYKTGVEVEAMHGAAITALTIYDMLKPVDKGVEISNIKLVSKHGGKTDLEKKNTITPKTAVIVCSDSVVNGKKIDSSGKKIIEKLGKYGIVVEAYEIVADDIDAIQNKLKQLTGNNFQMVLFTGGTGLSPRDVTPEAIQPMLDREIPGIMEAARNYGQQRTPYAMLSRGIAGFIGDTIVITLPGSTKAVTETMDAIFPYVLHLFNVKEGISHEGR
jgi:molybdenum cofactor biosynthesis protein MoaC